MRLHGDLFCNGKFRNPADRAINLGSATVDGELRFQEGFSSTGEVCLYSAEIGGNLRCEGQFVNEGGNGRPAIHISNAVIKRDVHFGGEAFQAHEGVSLHGAKIGGDLNSSGATFTRREGLAFDARSVAVSGNAYLNNDFLVSGAASLRGAHIGGLLSIQDALFRGALSLDHASVSLLQDRDARWPKKTELSLDGFFYGALSADSSDVVKGRLDWIRLQPTFVPQPYQQLARIYRQSGYDDEAQNVLIARERDRRRILWKQGKLGWGERLRSLFLAISIGYGYRPGRVIWLLIVLWLSGVLLFSTKASRQVMAAVKESPQAAGVTAIHCPSNYPCFKPAVYAAEVVVPLIRLNQVEYWQPGGKVSIYHL